MAPAPDGQNGSPEYKPWTSYASYAPYAPASQTETPQANAISQSTASLTPTAQAQTFPYQSYTSSSSLYTGPYASGNPNSNPDPMQAGAGGHNDGSNLPGWLMGTVIIIPLIIVGISAVALFLIIRARRRQRAAAGAMPEMKDLAPGRPRDERAYIRPPSSEPPTITVGTSTPSEARNPTTDTNTPPTQRQSQPVILSTTMDQAYYTGLDTADHISLSDVRSQTSVEPYEEGDEPPPPYRPRSVPPISRDASVRTSRTARTSSTARRNRNNSTDQSSQLLISGIRRSHDLRSPFEDPEDEDDAASAISEVTIRPQRHAAQGDRLSVVSDLSYQEEPTIPRSSLS